LAHIDLGHPGMKPAPLVRYDIAREASTTKRLLVGAIVAAAMIVVMAGLFLTTVN
jgi:hypothetical protein